jgi:hypothetical protein
MAGYLPSHETIKQQYSVVQLFLKPFYNFLRSIEIIRLQSFLEIEKAGGIREKISSDLKSPLGCRTPWLRKRLRNILPTR